MIRTITLTPSQPHVKGRYNKSDHVVALCDCTNGDFTTNLPDASGSEDVKLTFKKIDSSSNEVTISPVNNQTIDEYV